MDIAPIALSGARTLVTSGMDALGKGLQALATGYESEGESKVTQVRKFIESEYLEVIGKTFFGLTAVKIMRNIAPAIPEQFINFFGEMTGAGLSWWSTSHGSLNKKGHVNLTDQKPDFLQNIFNKSIKPVINFFLNMMGLKEGEKDINYLKFALTHLGLFTAGGLVLRNSEEENIPGINMDPDNSPAKTTFQISSYCILEMIAILTSQTIRYCKDYKEEFEDNSRPRKAGFLDLNVLPKALANVFNERMFPGNALSSIGGCLSTLWFGDIIGKVPAAIMAEALGKGFEGIARIHLRRSTKDRIENGKRVPNYRAPEWLKSVLSFSDSIFGGLRKWSIKLIAKIFKPEDKSLEKYTKELFDSLDYDKEHIQARDKI